MWKNVYPGYGAGIQKPLEHESPPITTNKDSSPYLCKCRWKKIKFCFINLDKFHDSQWCFSLQEHKECSTNSYKYVSCLVQNPTYKQVDLSKPIILQTQVRIRSILIVKFCFIFVIVLRKVQKTKGGRIWSLFKKTSLFEVITYLLQMTIGLYYIPAAYAVSSLLFLLPTLTSR